MYTTFTSQEALSCDSSTSDGNAEPSTTEASRTDNQEANNSWKPRFLAALAETGVVMKAVAAAGIPRHTAYAARKSDGSFAIAWAEARAEYVFGNFTIAGYEEVPQ